MNETRVGTVTKRASRWIYFFATLLMSPVIAIGNELGEELSAELGRKLVSISQNSYIHEQINRCRLNALGSESPPFAVRRRIEAPTDLMSRDQFVSLYTQLLIRNRIALASLMRPGIEPVTAVTALECRRANDQTPEVDFRIGVSMSATGIVVTTTDGTSNKQGTDRIEWAEILNLETD